MPFSVSIRRNVIPRVQASITDKSEEAVRNSARFMRDYAQSIAPVRTGAFRASLYVNGPNNESDYAEHAGQARALNPHANIIPELSAATIDTGVGQLRNALGQFSLPEAVMSSAVEYSVFLEEGTVHMAPQPVFRPAAMVAEVRFRNEMAQVADGY